MRKVDIKHYTIYSCRGVSCKSLDESFELEKHSDVVLYSNGYVKKERSEALTELLLAEIRSNGLESIPTLDVSDEQLVIDYIQNLSTNYRKIINYLTILDRLKT